MTQFAKGGPVTGPPSDSIPALLDNGYVLSAREVRELGAGVGALAKLNAEWFDPNAEWPTIPADINPDDVDAEALWAAWVDAEGEQ